LLLPSQPAKSHSHSFCDLCSLFTGAFAAYGILSNLNAGVLVTIAWLAVVKQTGLTPIDPGQVCGAAALLLLQLDNTIHQ
jgi:hypothetical protein